MRKPKSQVFYKFWLYLSAGFPPDVAVERAGVPEIAERLRQGFSLSSAMRTEGFPDFIVSLIEICEEGGISLKKIVYEIYEFLKEQEELEKKLFSTSLFPSLVLSISLFVILGYIIFVVPGFADLLRDFGVASSPVYTIEKFAGFVKSNFIFLFLIFGGVALLPFLLPKLISKLTFFDDMKNSIFFGSVAKLCDYGVDITRSIALSLPFLPPRKIKSEFSLALRHLQEGKIPKVDVGEFSDMIHTAFETGTVPQIFTLISQEFKKRFLRKSEILTKAIEPLLGLITGLFIVAIFLMIYIPVMRGIFERF